MENKSCSFGFVCWIACDGNGHFYLHANEAPTWNAETDEWLGNTFCRLLPEEVPTEFENMTWRDEPQKLLITVRPEEIERCKF